MKKMSNSGFYDGISPFYDAMVGSVKSVKSKSDLLGNFLTDETETAADIGCGSGNDSISLALNGLKVTGFDPSGEMVKLAGKNCGKYGLKIKFLKYSAHNIPEKFYGKFDAVFSLGNSFANIKPELLPESVSRIYRLLRGSGRFVLQVVNYHPVLKEEKRILNITRSRNNTYVRFYDFLESEIGFNILSINNRDEKDYKLFSTRIYPYGSELLYKVIREAGFAEIRLWSGLNKGKYERDSSKDLIIEAFK